ncbi:MAG TPA: DUF1972 domain-containing protein [Acidimicrobiales bacterium]|nr:DUF1972 domain-containing protein [Acidimicrobiales bacterium]
MPAIPRVRRRGDVLLVLVDVAVALGVCAVAYALRFEGVAVPTAFRDRYRVSSLVIALAWTALTRTSGLYRRQALRRGTSNLGAAFQAAVATGLALAVGNVVALGGDLSRAWIGLVVLGLLLGGVGSRRAIRALRRALVPLDLWLERYALVGTGPAGRRLLADLTRASGAPFRIVDVLPETLTPEELAAAARRLRVDGLILPGELLSGRDVGRLATAVSGSGVEVLVAPGLGGLDMRVSSIAVLHGIPLLRTAGLAPRRRARRSPPTGTAGRGIAILGTRGVPANYGGFETFAEALALRFVEAGTSVTVYCRTHYATQHGTWRGIRLVVLPTLRTKYLDTVVHTLVSAFHLVLRTRIREVVLCNAANAPVLLFLRLARRRVVLNVDGLEWRRGKWGVAGRAWYRLGEWLSVRLASVVVTDAEAVRTYYRVRHDTDTEMIPYGADAVERGSVPVPDHLGVQPDGYALYVSRWEEENNPVLVAEAHAESGVDLPLVMLGEATYDPTIDSRVRAAAAPSAVLAGAMYGEEYLALQANARCYVHATEVGGTHPALIEALAAGNLCLVLDTPENREVVGDHGRYFTDGAELADLLRWAAKVPRKELDQLRRRAQEYARARYSWNSIADAYRELLGA